MLTTRTGQYPIGFRRLGIDWQKNLNVLVKWSLENQLGVIDLGKDADTSAAQVVAAGMRIGSVDLPDWQGLLSEDKTKRADAVARTTAYVRAACKGAGGPLNFFVLMLPENPALPRKEVFGYMVESYAELSPVFEACDSAIVIEGWPGPGALCCTPETFRAFFEQCPSKAMGINFDPSHLIRTGIDPLRFLREFGDRVYHIHGKDTEILTEGLYEFGNTQPPTFFAPARFSSTYWRYTLPGHGVMRWIEAFRILQGFDYKGCVSIELEDANFIDGEEGTKAGILTGAAYLAGC